MFLKDKVPQWKEAPPPSLPKGKEIQVFEGEHSAGFEVRRMEMIMGSQERVLDLIGDRLEVIQYAVAGGYTDGPSIGPGFSGDHDLLAENDVDEEWDTYVRILAQNPELSFEIARLGSAEDLLEWAGDMSLSVAPLVRLVVCFNGLPRPKSQFWQALANIAKITRD